MKALPRLLDHQDGGLELRVLEEDGTDRRYVLSENSLANLFLDLSEAMARRVRVPLSHPHEHPPHSD